MDNRIINTSIYVDGMTCSSCELKVENKLKKQPGVKEAKVSLAEGKAYVTFDEKETSVSELIAVINKLGYQAGMTKSGTNNNPEQKNEKLKMDQLLGIGIIILALYIIIKHTIGFNFIPEINQSMGYGVLFVVGILTSLHCVAMCGGINLSQCVVYQTGNDNKIGKLKPSLLYNAGRVISYTVIGGIVGGLGSVVSFSGMAKGIVAVLAGIFMIIMGINMLNIFPWLKRFNISMPKAIGRKLYHGDSNKGPFYVGLLNGLMPCGPLQSMQLYALGTGSIAAGAASMFFFSLGTVPLMFGLGAVSTILSKKFTGKLMKVSAVLVVILGVLMVSRGMSLSGFNTVTAASGDSGVASINGDVQTVEINLASGRYSPITVQKGIPVRFIINAAQQDINGCNRTVIIPKYGVEKDLQPGQNVIEFTPEETGKIPYSCWMGMIRSNINVVDDITQINRTSTVEDADAAGLSGGASCCGTGANIRSLADTAIEDIYVPKAVNGVQEVKVTVDENGYSPNIIVLQKGLKAKFVFEDKNLFPCNSTVIFPEYQGSLDLSKGELETPELDISQNFGFCCSMGMMKGFVKVVEDANNVDLEAVKLEAQQYSPTGSAGAGGCCN